MRSQRIYWIQSSCRMFYKNGKPETIGLTHRLLTEVEGMMLLEKRTSLRAKLLSYDDSLLQSPGNLQSTAALPSISCDVTSLSLYMTGSEKDRYSTSKRQNTQFSTLPTRLKQPLSLPINRNLSAQASIITAEIQHEEHLSTRGRKRKKQNNDINVNQSSSSSILSVPQYSTFIMPCTSNNSKVVEMQDERQQQTAATACMGAPEIPRITQNENFTTTAATVVHGVSGTNTSMIPGLFQLSQDLTGFSGLTAYFSSDNNTDTVRHDQNYQWSSSTKANYWSSSLSSSDLHYQNSMTNNAGYATVISNGFYQSQMDQNNLIPVRNHMEYPTLFTTNNLASTDSTYTPTPAQLLLSSSELLQPSGVVQPANSMFKPSLLFDMPQHSTTNAFNTTINDYTQSMEVITADNDETVANCSNTSGSTGFNLISEVTNTLLG
ncbi:hypothetical protein LOAG_18167 [Loa loa]|uniref:Uncharacterized protein n=1 Tax=Loa loa TaxID=7209 RepID=A0A1S0UG18_LOALO|nr:hypothetical protein LOAG_18167 [Loa loa]EJD74525.1 hypothetical protein LOAG_18167 [Loa loa]